MIWKAPIPKKPVEGDLLVETKFAWFPKQVGDHKVWLERYQQLYEYVFRDRYCPILYIPVYCGGWDLVGEKVCRGVPRMMNILPPPGTNTEEKKKLWEKFSKEKLKEQFK